MKKKICHISTMHQTFDTRVFKKEAVSLAKSGYEVVLIIPSEENKVVDGVRIEGIRKHQTFLDRIYHLPKEAVSLAEQQDADLYHFHDPELLPYMKRLGKKNKPVIWDAHENYRDTIKSFNSLKLKPLSFLGSEWFNWLELRYAKKYFSGVVTITSKMASKYQQKQIKTCVLGNYAKVAHFKYNGVPDIAPKPRLLSSGAHFRPRAITEIAESYAFIDPALDAELFFSGKFVDENLLEDVKAIKRKVDPNNRITIEGALEYDDLINRAIPSAWVGTVLFDISDPNNRNGLPNRFFECWANGVPVIATDHTEVARVIRKHGGGLVIPVNSPQLIAEAFNKIASDINYRNQLSAEAYKAIKGVMNWETNFEDLLSFYKQILT